MATAAHWTGGRRAIAWVGVLAAVLSISGSTLPPDPAAVEVATAGFDRVAVRQAPDVRVLEAPTGMPRPGTVEVGDDPRVLTVGYETTSCRTFDGVSVVETAERVEVHLTWDRVHPRSYVVCRLRAIVGSVQVELEAPLGARPVTVIGSSTIPTPGPN